MNQSTFEAVQPQITYDLACKITERSLIITINIYNPYETYCVQIKSLETLQNLAQYFQSFEELEEHLRNTNHRQIDLENKALKIVIATNSRKTKYVTLATIPLQLVSLSVTDELRNFIQRCGQEKVIQDRELKKMLTSFAKILFSSAPVTIPDRSELVSNEQKIEPVAININQEGFPNNVQFSRLSSLQDLQNRLNQLTKRLQIVEQRYDDDYLQIKDEIIQLDGHVCQKINEKINELAKQFINQEQFDVIISKVQLLGVSMEQNQEKLKIFIEKNTKKWKPVSNPALWIHPQSRSPDQLLFNQNLIKTKMNKVQFFGKPEVSLYAVTFHKLTGFIFLGFANKNKILEGSHKNVFAFVTNGDNIALGDSFYCSSQQNIIKQGQTIEINLDRDQNKLEWKIGSQVLLLMKDQRISDSSYTWVPFIRIRKAGDCISISKFVQDQQ